ncbi:ABC transporter permease [Streptomyces sp. NPDC093252]|uniref:ABC transporter permease n=1 Tax=Streptomyces sp. NPDC093252 TaxID=3154980 RepID=UPI0034420053
MSTTTSPPQRRLLLRIVLFVPVIAALALCAFAWPAARTAPRDLPVGVAGPAAATAPVEQQLSAQDGAFEIHRYADEAAARDAVEDRTVYGALVIGPDGPVLLTASAGGLAVSQLLQQAAAGLGEADGTQVRTVDVVPAPAGDPRGSGFGSSVLPMALAGMAAGAMVTLLGLSAGYTVVALLGSAALVGVAATVVSHNWLEVLTGNWWAEAGALGLSVLAVSAAVAGLAALVGKPGMGVMAILMMLIGNPFSGASSAPELLPVPAGTIGQWLQPGAGSSLLRSVSYFDGAGAFGPALTLAWWAALGLGAVVLGKALKNRRPDAQPQAAEREPAPVG